ncbi:alpha/beta-hydrolase [Didymella exigua CBS 183.55]|uniref:Alpha/beta-hydrolase n=1 Tax=Didymella exigua CBS 183.55 TaxID=1150837 RepID=A0A6A5RZ92_9PLEO|nr:alpha/beta-hydrolase [Didymella exigua CBS 183.55]KAF1933182.1 alpha/beta-hydrolase [Didymella exigua CBS 183.55]
MKTILFILNLAALATSSPFVIRQNIITNSSANSFAGVAVTKNVQWVPCYGGNFTCLNLEVPLDYDDPALGSTNIAFVRHEAPAQPAVGDMILNPGGPGGSGVGMVLGYKRWRPLLGQKYNLIGMDPRGVNNSGPNVDPLINTPALRNEYATEIGFEYDSKSPAAVKKTFAHAGAYGDFTSQKLSDDVNYVNTPAVARDMLHFTELAAESRGESKDKATLNFFGVSYGSILGTTFAQLFPDRVGRMIIDGVMDPSDYYNGAWTKSITQGDDAVSAFASQCFDAGSKCGFFANDSNPEAILQRLDTILQDLETNPIGVSDPYLFDFPAVVSHMDLHTLIMSSTYGSYDRFPLLAYTLAKLEQRNGTILALALSKGFDFPGDTTCDALTPAYTLALTKYITACNDMDGRYNISSAEKYQEYIDKMQGVSKYLGPPWARVMTLYCRKLRFSPPKSQKFSAYKEVKTSSPILFVSNTIDPVTSSLKDMIKFFPGSGSFYQNAVGHGVVVTESACTVEHIIRYAETGELPHRDLVCQPNGKVFDIPLEATKVKRSSMGIF